MGRGLDGGRVRDPLRPRTLHRNDRPSAAHATKRWQATGRPTRTATELYRDAAWTLREFQDEYWIVGVTVTTIFETAWALRGYERLLTDLVTDPDLAAAILEIPYRYHLAAAQRLVEMGVDMIWVGDDVGSQAGMLISPELWRRLFKPKWAEFFATLKRLNPALKIAYHSDGVIDPIIPDFIEIGLDVLNPVQPACMDPARLKQQYGDHLSFWGTIDEQHTLPFGSPGDVTREVRARLETVGHDGGLIIGPTHHVQLDTPLENFGAMIHAITGHTLCLWFMILCSVLWAMGILPTAAACRAETPTIESPSLGIELDATTGLPARIETRWEHARRQWLTGPVRLTVRNEVTSSEAAVAPTSRKMPGSAAGVASSAARTCWACRCRRSSSGRCGPTPSPGRWTSAVTRRAWPTK